MGQWLGQSEIGVRDREKVSGVACQLFRLCLKT